MGTPGKRAVNVHTEVCIRTIWLMGMFWMLFKLQCLVCYFYKVCTKGMICTIGVEALELMRGTFDWARPSNGKYCSNLLLNVKQPTPQPLTTFWSHQKLANKLAAAPTKTNNPIWFNTGKTGNIWTFVIFFLHIAILHEKLLMFYGVSTCCSEI